MKYKLLFIAIILIGTILRLYRLGENPPSLYWDEASLGYNAFTIATAGRDEHGETFPIDRFIAFGDYKPPGYVYAIVPFISVSGISERAIRLPSAFAGIGMVMLTVLVAKLLFKNRKTALVAGLLFAISPWSIQLSRGAFEANLAAFFNLSGIFLFLYWVYRQKSWPIIFSILFFIASFYTFNANRIIAPLVFASFSLLYWKRVMKDWKMYALALSVGMVMLIPSLSFLMSRESRLRLEEVSIFTNLTTVQTANDRIEREDGSITGKLLHNRRILFAVDYLKHYSDHFSGRFLFTQGDKNPRLSIQNMGELYVLELPFLLLGAAILAIRRKSALYPILLWLLIVPIPAGMARETPHALRIASILPTFQLIAAYGIYQFFSKSEIRNPKSEINKENSKRRKKSNDINLLNLKNSYLFACLVLCIIFSVSSYYYIHNYYIHYPVKWSGEWQYGYKEMVQYVTRVQNNYDHIYITDAYGRPYIYFALYGGYPLNTFLSVRQADRDWFGFWTVSSLGKIRFEFSDFLHAQGRTLAVTPPGGTPDGFNILRTVKNLSGDIVFTISERNRL